MSDADWKCDLCGRKQAGGTKPPQGWMLLVIQDRYTNLSEERVLCGYCVEVVRADHLAKLDTTNLAERIAEQAENCIECCIGTYEGFRSEELKSFINELLAPILARNAAMEAVLRECRPYVQEAVNEDEREYNLRPLDEACRQNLEESSALLHGIDELTAKGAGQ